MPVLAKNIETFSENTGQDETYREELLYDSMVSIVDERVTSIEYSEDAVA